LTDELEPSETVSKVLTNGARWGQIGAALGLIILGSLAWMTTLSIAMITAGILMLFLGIYVAVSFRKINFVPSSGKRLRAFVKTLSEGIRYARSDRTILVILLVTFLINGADEVFSKLFAKRLTELGLPLFPNPIV
jgi:sulfite exporter TauE/SafE